MRIDTLNIVVLFKRQCLALGARKARQSMWQGGAFYFSNSIAHSSKVADATCGFEGSFAKPILAATSNLTEVESSAGDAEL